MIRQQDKGIQIIPMTVFKKHGYILSELFYLVLCGWRTSCQDLIPSVCVCVLGVGCLGWGIKYVGGGGGRWGGGGGELLRLDTQGVSSPYSPWGQATHRHLYPL